MSTSIQLAKLTLREGLFTLGIFALLLLGFGHQPVSATAQSAVRADAALLASDWCGGTPAREHGAHGPCHACQVSVADLPQSAGKTEAAFGRSHSTEYAQVAIAFAQTPSHYTLPTRGPPTRL